MSSSLAVAEAELLPMEQIECRATELLVSLPPHVWNGADLPIPVEEIADSQLGLLVLDREDIPCPPPGPDGESRISGLLIPARREIWIDADEARQWPARRRFTIAHEIGHWLLHRDRSGDGDETFCRATVVHAEDEEASVPTRKPKRDYPPAEVEANAFAAALLMPAPLIRMKYEEMRARELDFAWLCRRFDCSGAAMGRRLHSVV